MPLAVMLESDVRNQTVLAILTIVGAFTATAATAAEPVVIVSPVTTAKGDAMHVRASMEIAASPAKVWAILSDCAGAPKVIPHLESCKVLKRDAGGRWDIREHVVNPPFLPKLRMVVRNEFKPPSRLEFRLLSGDMKASDGAWTLTRKGTGSILAYDAIVAPGFPAPQFLVARSIGSDFPRMLRAIAKESVKGD